MTDDFVRPAPSLLVGTVARRPWVPWRQSFSASPGGVVSHERWGLGQNHVGSPVSTRSVQRSADEPSASGPGMSHARSRSFGTPLAMAVTRGIAHMGGDVLKPGGRGTNTPSISAQFPHLEIGSTSPRPAKPFPGRGLRVGSDPTLRVPNRLPRAPGCQRRQP